MRRRAPQPRPRSTRSPIFGLALALTALDPAAAHAAESGDFAGSVDIGGGRKMYLECRGSGSPTVVFVAGLKGSAEDWNIAEKQAPTVFAEVAKFTRVCAYDRPGTPVGEKPSRSDPVQQPTTAQDAVSDLHALLSAAKEPTPYVMVGHSYGGLVAKALRAHLPPRRVRSGACRRPHRRASGGGDTGTVGDPAGLDGRRHSREPGHSTRTWKGSTRTAASTRSASPRHFVRSP